MASAGDYVIVRAKDDGVKCGFYVRHCGREVVLGRARQIWSWNGNRLSLIDVSVLPGDVKISQEAHGEIHILDACGIIPVSPTVAKHLQELPYSLR